MHGSARHNKDNAGQFLSAPSLRRSKCWQAIDKPNRSINWQKIYPPRAVSNAWTNPGAAEVA